MAPGLDLQRLAVWAARWRRHIVPQLPVTARVFPEGQVDAGARPGLRSWPCVRLRPDVACDFLGWNFSFFVHLRSSRGSTEGLTLLARGRVKPF